MNRKLRHPFQVGHAWWNYYCAHADKIRPVVVDNLIKLFSCGTSALGFASWRCQKAGCTHTKRICFTCHSRSCPSCGKKATERWVAKQRTVLPITKWQHITFTFPREFWPLFELNRALLTHLSRLAAKVILDFCQPKNLLPGLFTALHTHGRALNWHPHVHLSVTCGGLDDNAEKWKKITFSGKTLMKQWRYQIITLLRQQWDTLQLPPELSQTLTRLGQREQFLDFHYQRHWNIDLAKPTDNAQQTLNYLGRYLKKPPVSLSRLEHYNGQEVTYRYLSHKTREQEKLNLSMDEFIQRFISHIPDKHFRMVRYYGFLAPRRRTTLLPIIDALLGQEKEKTVNITYAAMLKRLSRIDPHECILCGSRLVLSGITSGLPWHQLMLHHESLAKMKGI
ncbi:IS91 family transposase [Candidatus Fukatsuia endosymbiont of Tuberolachnus salignus]|uniref:IS91 family transposase n=1 Tax=Candidatus Fukatsuia endosymbiont of Tuberolachnus salignus TaxID=3077957 RepID=UPI00313AFF94